MPVKVKILERDFATNTPNIYYKVFQDADRFDIVMDKDQEGTHLAVLCDKEMVAFFPSGGWLSAEKIKE